MFIDSHAHLFFKDFETDLKDVLSRARDAGIVKIVCPGTDLETSRASVRLAEEHDMIFACVGFHPHDAAKADEPALREIEELSDHAKVVAIGEIGLDYHYNFSPPEVQRGVFAKQIAIARRRNLPIVIHSREAESDTLGIVGAAAEDSGWKCRGGLRGVFHCFPGDPAMAETVIGWDFLISIPGPVTFASKPARPNLMAAVAAAVPLTSMMLETDSPYLAPVPHRGSRNEPSRIPVIADAVAKLRQTTREAVGESTTAAAIRLFGLS